MMFIRKERSSLTYYLIFVSWFLCFIVNINVVDSFTVKNVRGRDFSGRELTNKLIQLNKLLNRFV